MFAGAETIHLISATVRQVHNRLRSTGAKGWFRFAAFMLFGLSVGVAVGGGSYWLFSRLHGIALIGPFIGLKLFSLMFLFLFFFLTMSHVLNSISSFYLAEDLSLLHSLPVKLQALFQARFLECFWRSSWMTWALLMLPLWLYGFVERAPWFFYPSVLLMMMLYSLIPASLGIGFTFALLSIFPARKLRDLLLLLAVAVAGGLYLFFRMLKPEHWLYGEGFGDMVQWLNQWSLPHTQLLPSHWFTELLGGMLIGTSRADRSQALLYAGLFVTTPLTLYFLCEYLYQTLYLDGWWKSQENPLAHRLMRSKAVFVDEGHARQSPLSHRRLLMLKELKLMLRDPQRFVQLILIAALVAVYAYNFKVVRADFEAFNSPSLKLFFVLLNLGFAALVLAALTVRFAYPSVSLEGRAFWILKSAPIAIRTYLWSKFWFFYAWAVLLAVLILGMTNFILGVNWQVHFLAQGILLPFVAVLVALAVGMGAYDPQLKAEHHSQITTGFGAMAYMTLALFIIIVFFLCVARVGWTWFNIHDGKTASGTDWLILAGSMGVGALILILGMVIPMRMGIKSLQQFEE